MCKGVKDHETAELIIKSKSPKYQKQLGRKVKDFDEDTWKSKRSQIVYDHNMAKFTQNIELLKILLSLKDKIFVEASPYDKIWGIGMTQTDALKCDPKDWKGLILLGFALTKIKDKLRR